MNKIIKQQLEEVKSVKLSYNDTTTEIFIPRTTQIIPEALIVGNVYIIELNEFVLQPSSNSMLASNWNSGKIPKYKIYKVELLEIINNMYKFNGIALDENYNELYSENWYGWFPKEYFKVLEKVN